MTVLDTPTIRDAVELACHAPSLYNSQPWKWVAHGSRLELFAVPDPQVQSTDRSGRELLLSCGAVLDHLRVAIAAASWYTTVRRFPDADDPHHLATCDFERSAVEPAHRQRAEAILRRRTDRLPFAAPPDWQATEAVLRSAAGQSDVTLDVIPDDGRRQLAEASRLTEDIRRHDPTYQSELRWWTSPFEFDQGLPSSSRLSESEAARVDIARAFPTTGYGRRRPQVESDRSKVVVLSTRGDTSDEVLRCGEALSAVLLECTLAGLATCTLTHMIEVAPARELIRGLIRRNRRPQLLIRVGTPVGQQPPATPRRPLGEVLEFGE